MLRRKAAAMLILAAALAGCGGSASSIPPPRASVTTAHPASCPAPKAAPAAPGMQLAARTSVGTGALAAAWATAILTAMNDPASNANVASLIAWFTAEDDHKPAGQMTYGAGENNPLQVTADSGDNVGVVGTEPSGAGPGHPGNLDFSSPDYGVAATAEVIVTRYPVISQALLRGGGLIGNRSVSAELAQWSGDGYSSLR